VGVGGGVRVQKGVGVRLLGEMDTSGAIGVVGKKGQEGNSEGVLVVLGEEQDHTI